VVEAITHSSNPAQLPALEPFLAQLSLLPVVLGGVTTLAQTHRVVDAVVGSLPGEVTTDGASGMSSGCWSGALSCRSFPPWSLFPARSLPAAGMLPRGVATLVLTCYIAREKVSGRMGSGVRECGTVEMLFGIVVIIVALLLGLGLWPG
jgi:hypothetical protein